MGQCSSCCPCWQSDYTPIKDHDDDEDHGHSHAHKHNDDHSHQHNHHQERNASLELKSTSQPSTSSSAAVRPSGNNNGGASSSSANNSSSANLEFDMNSPVFKGAVVQQKFFNKSTYDPKFAWINLKSRSLCLSEHMTKERRHKEASLGDVTGVIAGPPEKYKAIIGANGEPQHLDPNLCLSVKFVRGGGIDLKFQTMEERDLWSHVIMRLIAQPRSSTQQNASDKQ